MPLTQLSEEEILMQESGKLKISQYSWQLLIKITFLISACNFYIPKLWNEFKHPLIS